MCGIVGLFRPEGVTRADQALVEVATARLRHRGPDGAGFWHTGPVAFGHARLAIIDLATGQQPLLNEDGTIAVILNGEIYNYTALTEHLEAKGHRFRTHADTEVIVHGYEEWGDAVVDHLDGMFAFAVWDDRRKRLLLGRDRFGEKPLYYTSLTGQHGTFWFASEIKALLSSKHVPRRFATEHLDEYLLYRNVLAPDTMFAGIYQVRPGHILVADLEGLRERRYYAPGSSVLADESVPGTMRFHLERSIEQRMMADVSLGTVLSGGIDSSLVSAIAARYRPGIPTFCVGFNDPEYDERTYARAVATDIGSSHHELVLTSQNVFDELRRLTWANDEPLTHPNSIAMHLVFRFAKMEHGVTVLLSGEGADEVFGGYGWYRAMKRRDALLRLPGMGILTGILPGNRGKVMRRVMDRDYPLLANGFAGRDQVSRLLGRPVQIPASRRDAWPSGARQLSGMFQYDQRTYLPALLQRQDRMSMAAGVEARVVFLDHHLVEWANALSPDRKVGSCHRKLPLRQLITTMLPTFPLSRPKVGFALPLHAWMSRGGDLAGAISALTTSTANVAAWCDPSVISTLITDNQNGRDRADVLWTLLALEEWASIFLKQDSVPIDLPGVRSSLLPTASSWAPRVEG